MSYFSVLPQQGLKTLLFTI